MLEAGSTNVGRDTNIWRPGHRWMENGQTEENRGATYFESFQQHRLWAWWPSHSGNPPSTLFCPHSNQRPKSSWVDLRRMRSKGGLSGVTYLEEEFGEDIVKSDEVEGFSEFFLRNYPSIFFVYCRVLLTQCIFLTLAHYKPKTTNQIPNKTEKQFKDRPKFHTVLALADLFWFVLSVRLMKGEVSPGAGE